MSSIHALIGWIDQQLGRITMYSLVFYSLIAMVLMAFSLVFTQNLGFQPIWFVASALVIVGVSHFSNRLIGTLFGVKTHDESAWITGLILFLLFLPPTSVLDLLKLAIVAMIAMASKYVLAVHNRHIFNPAAFALVIASISGLAFAGWWIATPAMIPITAIVALLILRRTQKLRMGLIFIAVALASLYVQGTDPISALSSWPILFFAGVMLSEPLTLAPRAKQQYAQAAIVGLLMTLPLRYGVISMNPALALVIVNVIGWWFGQRREIRLRFVGKKKMSASTYDFVFDTQAINFEPGQYLEMSLMHSKSDIRGSRRVFSIASKPNVDQINIGTKIPDKPSSFKRALMSLQPGDIVYATRIGGDFVLPKDPNVPVVCIAGGIGITPFMSFCESGRPIRLIYSVSRIDDLSYIDALKQHDIDVVVVSPDNKALPDPDWIYENGSVNGEVLKKYIDISSQPAVYISGPPAMVMKIRSDAKSIGIKTIKVDEFSGY